MTYDYSYNGLGQLTKVEWTVGSDDFENVYSYDANGNLTEKLEKNKPQAGSWTTTTKWAYTWEVRDRLVAMEERDGGKKTTEPLPD